MDSQTILMKLLLLGANGQVGRELQRSLAPLGELKVCDSKYSRSLLISLKNFKILLEITVQM